MRIAILTFGTRGDVQPFVVIGDHLAQQGHEVVVGVCSNLVEMVEASGLTAVELPIDSKAFMESPDGVAFLAAGKTTKFLSALGKIEKGVRAEIAESVVETCRDADVVIASVLMVARAVSVVEKSGQRLVPIYTLPIEPTGDYASPYLAPGGGVPTRALKRFTHRAFQRLYWVGSKSNVRELRRQIGLPGAGPNPLLTLNRNGAPIRHLISPALMPASAEWPPHVTMIGSPVVPASLREVWGEATVDPALEAWLAAGDAPVFFGFGSMPVLDPRTALTMIGQTARALGVRALVGAGWSTVGLGEHDDGRVFVTAGFDHDRVLPQCRAAVHHGGAGTTHAVVRAGIPAVVAHVFADQPLWGRQLVARGLGDELAYQQVSAAALVGKLRPLLTSDALARARAASEQMATDEPLAAITAAVEGRMVHAGG